jgi:hypothetical protein
LFLFIFIGAKKIRAKKNPPKWWILIYLPNFDYFVLGSSFF